MVSLFGNLFRRKDHSHGKLREAEGFRIATPEEVWGNIAPLRKQASQATTPDAILAYADSVRAAIAGEDTTPWGVKVAAASHYWIADCENLKGPAEAEAHVAPFEAAYRLRPEPYTAVLLAQACYDVADEFRGTDWTVNTDDASLDLSQQWNMRGYKALSAQDEAVKIDETGRFDPLNYPWYAQYYNSVSRLTCTHDDVVEGFNQVIQLDPTNLQLLREHGQDMLPRWYGKDEHSLERFALWAMEATQQTYGRGAYAYIYGLIAILGVDVDETVVNVELLDAGYSDLRQRFPCLNLENEHANALSWADAESRVLSLFNEGLRVIDYRAWGGDDEAEGMEYALNAYTYARDNG
ncbi:MULTISPECIES: hypothetical protein [unclassified Brevundimonas]|uniref:hypothetical protein n=1 Tax=unclassified Brevundimonas TaxID=2622653 RepID=UPI0025C4497E|nr:MULTISPECIES: hypothetical protein [unclassified Brevundimonas]